jgi:hypothetical protein
MSLRLSAQAALAFAAFVAAGIAEPAAAQSGRAQFYPNSRKYSDAGAKAASGRSGSASLEGRALLAKDGSALIEASTGSLEAGTSPGQIRKVQVRLLSNTGAQLAVDNYNGLSGTGYWSKSYADLARNTKVEIQANVGGIDGNRTDLVTVATLVKRSPDVAMTSVTAPTSALAGTRFNIVGNVAEENGDVGARATCVLAIDGRSVDQASGIWVDAGQNVSCAFQTTLTAVGTHQIQVYATGVSPTDWDGNNNSASATVEVLSPELTLNYVADFNGSDIVNTNQFNKTSPAGDVDNTAETRTNKSRSLTLTASTKDKSFAFPVTVRSALATAGVSLFDLSSAIAYDAGVSTATADCGAVYQTGFSVTVCNNHSAVGANVALATYGGRVTYVGTRSYTLAGEWYFLNLPSSDVGSGLDAYTIGSDIKPVIELTDSHGMLFSSRPALALASTPVSTNYHSCSTNKRTGITTCTTMQSHGTNVTGHAMDTSH